MKRNCNILIHRMTSIFCLWGLVLAPEKQMKNKSTLKSYFALAIPIFASLMTVSTAHAVPIAIADYRGDFQTGAPKTG